MSERNGRARRRAANARTAFELPALLAEIADAAGLPAALAVAQVRGGTRTHFPSRCADDHWLTAIVQHMRAFANRTAGGPSFRAGFPFAETRPDPLPTIDPEEA